MEQKWYIIIQIDQMQLIHVKTNQVSQLLLLFMVVIIRMPYVCFFILEHTTKNVTRTNM